MAINKVKNVIDKIRNNPYRLRIVNTDEKTLDDRVHDTYLIRVDGSELKPIKVEKNGDMRKLTYKDDSSSKTCAITSKPLYLNGREFYFTRHGYKGTMAINKDTLLDTDAYRLKDGSEERDNGFDGDIEELKGSKEVLHEMNKGTRLKKLLQKQDIPVSRMLAYIGAGAGIGLFIAQYFL